MKVSRRVVTWCCILLSLWSTTGAFHHTCSRTSFYLNPNQTWCPTSSRTPDFSKYGFPADDIPRDLSNYLPRLLHERSVIHHVDMNKDFIQVGSGHEGVVYRAEIRDTGIPVIVKTLKDKTFHQIYHEAQILTYLNDVTSVPRLVGLLPTGPERNNLSIVSEYVRNSSTLGSWFNNSNKISQCQWLNISYQIAASLRSVNEKHILHNDLHHKNILIQWKGSAPQVYFIDFGDSTFRHGRAVKNFNPYHNKSHQFYLPPEVSYDQSTPASDAYSFGQNLKIIAGLSRLKELTYLATKCISKDPDLRISVVALEQELQHLLQLSCPHPVLKTTELVKESHNLHDTLTSFHHMPLPILQLKDLTQMQSMKHLPTAENFVIRSFQHSSFEYIRHFARVNLYLNHTSYVPWFKGVVFTGSELSSMALVQEAVRDSVTLSAIVHNIPSLSEVKRIEILRELANAMLVFNQRDIGCRRLYADDILISLENRNPRVIFNHLGKMYYGTYPKKEYSKTRLLPVSVRKKSPRYYNKMRFSEIVQLLLPEVHYESHDHTTVNFSSIISVDISPISHWVFLSS